MTDPAPRPLRIAMLAKGWTGFLDTSFRRLAERDVELLIVSPSGMRDTNYPAYAIDEYAQHVVWEGAPDEGTVISAVTAFKPDAVLVHSWEIAAYRAALRTVSRSTLRVLWMDNIWLGTARQWIGRMTSRIYLRPLFDAVMVPSDRTEFFARRLGFHSDQVIRGAWSADTDLFSSPPRSGIELRSRHRFVSALRLVHHKGADVLASAYSIYRDESEHPWDLDIAGIGPLAEAFSGIAGVTMHGFLRPEQLADLMRDSSCYINPSRQEPYGLVLHEAAASGLPILCGDMIGAAPTMVQDGANGWVVPGGDVGALVDAMHRMSGQDAQRLETMSSISLSVARRLSPVGWATNIEEEVRRRSEAWNLSAAGSPVNHPTH